MRNWITRSILTIFDKFFCQNQRNLFLLCIFFFKHLQFAVDKFIIEIIDNRLFFQHPENIFKGAESFVTWANTLQGWAAKRLWLPVNLEWNAFNPQYRGQMVPAATCILSRLKASVPWRKSIGWRPFFRKRAAILLSVQAAEKYWTRQRLLPISYLPPVSLYRPQFLQTRPALPCRSFTMTMVRLTSAFPCPKTRM